MLGNWCSLNTVVENLWKKNCWRPDCGRVSLHFNKIPNSLRHVLQIYSQICIFCVPQKKSSRSSQRRLISKCHGNLVVKLMTMWWNSYYIKFWVRNNKLLWDIRYIIFHTIFKLSSNVITLQFYKLKNLSYRMVRTLLCLLCNLWYRMQFLPSFFKWRWG